DDLISVDTSGSRSAVARLWLAFRPAATTSAVDAMCRQVTGLLARREEGSKRVAAALDTLVASGDVVSLASPGVANDLLVQVADLYDDFPDEKGASISVISRLYDRLDVASREVVERLVREFADETPPVIATFIDREVAGGHVAIPVVLLGALVDRIRERYLAGS